MTAAMLGPWRKSTRSSGGNGNCVEVADGDAVVGVRDTKDRDGGILVVSTRDWVAFVVGVT